MTAAAISSPPGDSERSSNLATAWLIVGLLVPVALLNYLDRQMMAAMKGSMMIDIADIETQANWGLALGTFKWVYAFLSPVGGYLADRFSRRHVIAASLFVWSAVTWGTGHVSTFHELLIARGLMGISEACYIPAALALITEFHLGSTRSRAIGLHQMGMYAGIILGGFAGYVADDPQFGCRWAFSACGLVGLIYSVPLFTLLRNPQRSAERQAPVNPLAAVGELFSNGSYVLMIVYFTLPALAGWVVKDWMPDILKEKFHLGQGKAGFSAVVYVQTASLIGVGLGGWLADFWMRKTIRGRIFVSALGMSFFLPSLFGVGNAATLRAAIGFLMLFGVGWGFFDCNNMPILSQIVRRNLLATAYGFMNLVSISCGGFADWGFGALLDRNVPLNFIFGAFAAVALLSIGVVMLIRPRPELAEIDAGVNLSQSK